MKVCCISLILLFLSQLGASTLVCTQAGDKNYTTGKLTMYTEVERASSLKFTIHITPTAAIINLTPTMKEHFSFYKQNKKFTYYSSPNNYILRQSKEIPSMLFLEATTQGTHIMQLLDCVTE